MPNNNKNRSRLLKCVQSFNLNIAKSQPYWSCHIETRKTKKDAKRTMTCLRLRV